MDAALIAQALADFLGLPVDQIQARLERPPRQDWGDVSYPCFELAKRWRRSPQDIAAELAATLPSGTWTASAAGGYLNFAWHREKVLPGELRRALQKGVALPQTGTGKTVVLEFGSPNVAKPISMGNLFPTIIGHALSRMYQALGWKVIGINHLGDWGSQFGKVLAAYHRWGQEEEVRGDPVNALYRLYVHFHAEAPRDPGLGREAQAWLQRLEGGDLEAHRLWRWFVEASTDAFLSTYARLGVTFDHVWGESFYKDRIPDVVQQLRSDRLLETSQGAQVVRVGDDIPPCIIVKSDGTSIYAARDVAAAIYRYERFGFDQMIYVVGAEQTLHFTQVFRTLKRMGYPWADNCHHVGFGLIRLEGRKMSSRRGDVVLLEDVLDEAVRRVAAIIDGKRPRLKDKARIAEVVGVGAVVFHGLKNQRMRDLEFNWAEVLSFEGETGPYVQYTQARIHSLMEKAQFQPQQFFQIPEPWGPEHPVTTLEWELWSALSGYENTVVQATVKNEPFLVARRLLDISQSFNGLYNNQRILSDDINTRIKLLALSDHTGQVLKHGLNLLGIEAPDTM